MLELGAARATALGKVEDEHDPVALPSELADALFLEEGGREQERQVGACAQRREDLREAAGIEGSGRAAGGQDLERTLPGVHAIQGRIEIVLAAQHPG